MIWSGFNTAVTTASKIRPAPKQLGLDLTQLLTLLAKFPFGPKIIISRSAAFLFSNAALLFYPVTLPLKTRSPPLKEGCCLFFFSDAVGKQTGLEAGSKV